MQKRYYVPNTGAQGRGVFQALRSMYLEGYRVKHAMVRAWRLCGEPK